MFPLLLAPLLLAAPGPAVRLTADATPAVEVSGLTDAEAEWLAARKPGDAAWVAVFRVVVAEGVKADDRPPLLGAYRVEGRRLAFTPRFPLVPGVRYRAVLDLNAIPVHPAIHIALVTADLVAPEPPAGPPTRVTAVYPSASILPENALRLYVHFSGPVSRQDVYRHLALTRDDGTKVALPFLELDEQLWSADGTRLTLLFDPGRVKRGLVPREEDGPILEQGRRYTFALDPKWEDAAGRPLASGVRKTFTAGPPDDAPVDPATWSLMTPRRGSDAPLIVRLAKPHDHALLGRMVWVTNAAGEKVTGTVTVGGGERVVTFAPAKPWPAGKFHLVIDTRLEDTCGNRVGEPFEVDVFKPVTRKVVAETVTRAFEVP